MNIRIDKPALSQLRLLRLARGRAYYLAEPPILGIVVVRWDTRIEELASLVVDSSLGYERGIEGWCSPGFSEENHGKATLYRITEASPDLLLSAVLSVWRQRYPMK